MTKTEAKPTFEKLCHSMSYVKEAVSKIRSKTWAEPVGKAMMATSSILECFNWVPGIGIVGGALKMGSSLLNPALSLEDLSKQVKEIETHMNGSTGYVKDLLKKQIQEIEVQMENPQPELLDDFDIVRDEIQSSAITMSKDMTKIESDLSDVKNIVRQTYNIVVDSRYKEGIEKVDAAFQNFINGSHNLEITFSSLANFMFELETNAIQSLNTEKITAYLKAIKETEDDTICDQVFQYIIIVRAKYLQISCAYYIFKQDTQRVANEFENFNNDYHELNLVYKRVIGRDFQPGKSSKIRTTDIYQDEENRPSQGNASLEMTLRDQTTLNYPTCRVTELLHPHITSSNDGKLVL